MNAPIDAVIPAWLPVLRAADYRPERITDLRQRNWVREELRRRGIVLGVGGRIHAGHAGRLRLDTDND